ncbi:MAG TPA: TetR family transcriptional regulator [Streptosporangiaceae bacterium]|jgi:AcrR family transcriptional regulator
MAIDLVRMALAHDHGENGDEATERILDAALGQFEDFGLRRSTMEDIARRCGMSRITIYRRFPKKENLIEAVLLRELRSFLDCLLTVGEDGLSAEGKMVERVAFALQYLRNHLLLRRLLRTEPESILPSLTVSGGPVVDTAREYVAALIRADLFGSRTPPAEAERHVQILAELGVRIVLSFILTPSSAIPMETLDDARAFASDLITPVHASVLSEMARASAEKIGTEA